MPLTAAFVKSVKNPGRYADGQNLYLDVRSAEAKSWFVRIQWRGRRRDIGLGSAGIVSLADARDKARDVRKAVQAGHDPVEAKKAAKKALAAIPTFREASKAFHAERKSDWRNEKHRAQWLSTLETYVFPSVGSMAVDKVLAGDIRDLLSVIWQSKPETARRVLQRVIAVLNWAHSKGYRPAEAPAAAIKTGLGRQNDQPKHFSALDHSDVSFLMAKLSRRDTQGRLALRFLILTAGRSGEVRGAPWSEIDFVAKTWTVPPERMKAKKQHVVPLSGAALEVLKIAELARKGGADELIFRGSGDRALSDMTLTKVLRTEIGGDWTVHGFRSSFRVWAATKTNFPHDAAEAALAHTNPNRVVAAYLRTDFLDERRRMMRDWAAYIDPSRGLTNGQQKSVSSAPI